MLQKWWYISVCVFSQFPVVQLTVFKLYTYISCNVTIWFIHRYSRSLFLFFFLIFRLRFDILTWGIKVYSGQCRKNINEYLFLQRSLLSYPVKTNKGKCSFFVTIATLVAHVKKKHNYRMFQTMAQLFKFKTVSSNHKLGSKKIVF